MFPNLRAEMARKHITIEKFAEMCGKSTSTISSKLNGKIEITLSEAKKIRETLGVEMTLDELFEEE